MPEQSQKPMFGGDCPRCGQRHTTFDILAEKQVDWASWPSFETFLVCRNCHRSSIALLKKYESGFDSPLAIKAHYANTYFVLKEWVFEIPGSRAAPEYVPAPIQRIFNEAANCAAIGAFDAAGTMFRKVLDVATRDMAPEPVPGSEDTPPNWKTYKDLRLRLDWLFVKGILGTALKDLSSCIHEDGNDAAHDAAGITSSEADDLGDFAERVLEALFTVPGQIEENRRRRDERRGSIATAAVGA